jgi:tetratricopeptide (TPR) repeat protein
MKPPLPVPARRWTWFTVIALAAAVAVALGAYWWRGSVRAQIARNAAANVPDLREAHPELAGRIRAALDQIQHHQHPADALATLTRLYYANGWLEPAAATCAGMMELEPRQPFWTYLLARLRSNRGQLDEALPLLQRTIELAPDYLPPRLKAAEAMAKLNQVDAAIAMERTVLARDAANIYAWVGLGNIYAAQQKWDAARDSFQHAIAAADGFRPAWLGLVSVYDATGNTVAATEAQEHVDDVSRSPDSPDPWIDGLMEECYNVYYLRVAAFSSTDLAYSRGLLERAVRLQPQDAATQRDFGMLLFRAKAFEEAQRTLLLATTLAPDESENWLSLLVYLRAIRDEAGTEQAIRDGLAHCPASPGLWLERGRLLARARAFDGAFAAFAKAAALEPNDAAPHVESAVAYFQLQQTESALRELKLALAVEPNHPFAQIVMARYAIMAGDKPTAQAFLAKARLNPKVSPEDKKQLVETYETAFGPAGH